MDLMTHSSADHLVKVHWVPVRDRFLGHGDGSIRLIHSLSEMMTMAGFQSTSQAYGFGTEVSSAHQKGIPKLYVRVVLFSSQCLPGFCHWKIFELNVTCPRSIHSQS